MQGIGRRTPGDTEGLGSRPVVRSYRPPPVIQGAAPLPLALRWTAPTGPRPVPVKPIHPAPRGRPKAEAADALVPVLPPGPLDFSDRMGRLIADVIARCPEFQFMRPEHLFVGVTQARNGRTHGLQAKVTPMRFAGGALVQRRRGRLYQVQRYWIAGIEQFYLVTFCLPRFLDQTFEEKFVTIFHELYHVSPAFNGDLRRHAGRCCLHTTSQKQFDRSMAELAAAYLRGGADPELYTFLRYNFAQLRRHTDGVVGQVLPMPKLVPVG